jgi:two-component system OmpR family sensor kinase/two-component system sensor histidine kinase BaeS
VLFFRFVLVFGLFVLLGCGGLAALGALLLLMLQRLQLPFPPPVQVEPDYFRRLIPLLLGLAFLFFLALRWVGRLAARRYTSPLSETMRVADLLAEGDLSARVTVEGSGEFRRFSRSFNRMAEALEVSDRQRRELLADVAHELRTPLTIIQGNLEGLRDDVYEATPDHIDLILDEAKMLGRLVDDLRLLTLAEAGQLALHRQALDVQQLLDDVREAFVYQAGEAGITLIVQAPAMLPTLQADPQRLGQVLGNLVANALRHTPRGGVVTLGASLLLESELLELRVTDTGEGIAAEDLPRIFDRFWRADPARSHETGAGSGLGLAIAKSLVEAHDGHIRAESQPQQGTTVRFVLPVSASAET